MTICVTYVAFLINIKRDKLKQQLTGILVEIVGKRNPTDMIL